jgi:hypothetical protein
LPLSARFHAGQYLESFHRTRAISAPRPPFLPLLKHTLHMLQANLRSRSITPPCRMRTLVRRTRSSCSAPLFLWIVRVQRMCASTCGSAAPLQLWFADAKYLWNAAACRSAFICFCSSHSLLCSLTTAGAPPDISHPFIALHALRFAPGTDVATPCAEAPHVHCPDFLHSSLLQPSVTHPWRAGLPVLVGHALRAHMSNGLCITSAATLHASASVSVGVGILTRRCC